MKIAACLITKNSEATLERCLGSIRPFVDGIFVYDTGSTDGTFELLERLNEETEVVIGERVSPSDEEEGGFAQQHRVPLAPIEVKRGDWRDDFSWARERSWEMPGDEYEWAIWLDDDDIVEGAQHLRGIAATAAPELDGFIFLYDYARDDLGNCVCQLWRERLMRRDRGYTWRGVVHEVLCPPEGRPPALVMLGPDVVRYVHERPPDRYPPERNLTLLRADAERIEAEGGQIDPRTLAYLGTELMMRGNPEAVAEAATWLERYIGHPEAGWSDERMQVHHKLAQCLRILGQHHASAEVEFRALRERDDWAETYIGLAESFAMLADWPRVERWAKRALELGMPQSPLILNPLEFSFVPLVRLSEAAINTGRYAEAQEWLGKAAQVAPSHPLIAERQAQYESARFEGELVQAMLTMREAAIRFDENLKALQLLEAAPYVIQDHPAIVQARAAARENCRHISLETRVVPNPEYTRWYCDDPKESTVTDEFVPRAAEVFHRVGFLEHGLEEQAVELGRKPTVLDLGCNDFWVGAYLMTRGYDVDGVELNRRSYELALERAERFRIHGAAENGSATASESGSGSEPVYEPYPESSQIVHGDLHDADKLLEHRRYDAISLFEVIEHVADPEVTLAVCEKLLNPGGRIYVSTPDGAFEHGNLARWSVVERKGHLRAWPGHEFADRLSDRGVIKTMDYGQGLAVVSYTPQRHKGKVIFYAGGCFEKWAPTQALDKGLGGSETALVQVATRLAVTGWKVKVYADVDAAMTFGGVIWRPHTAWDPMEECDAMVISRIPAVFDAPMRARARVLWCHDHSYAGQLTEARAEKMTHVVVLSEWERDRYARLYPFLADKLTLIRNGITLEDFLGQPRYPDAERPFGERKPRAVYSSSADRGLDVLLELWPRIRERCADAELYVYYGWDVFDRVALTNPGLLEYKQRVLVLAEKAGGEEGGVFFRGRQPQPVLAEEMQQARVWAYPTAFLETSCIGAMEARAAGLALVTSDLGGLRESVGTHGVMLPWPPDEDDPGHRHPDYQDAFVDAVAKLLTDEKEWAGWHRRARAGISACEWSRRTPEWEAILRDGLVVKPRRRGGRKAAVEALAC